MATLNSKNTFLHHVCTKCPLIAAVITELPLNESCYSPFPEAVIRHGSPGGGNGPRSSFCGRGAV